MQAEKNAIYQKLKADSSLLSMLADNPPYANPSGTKSKANSIVPAGAATAKTATPFITIQGGGEVQVGRKFFVETMYIRVYDAQPKYFVRIDQVMEKIKSILDHSDLTLTENRFIQIEYESALTELTDEALNLNFREAVFRISLLSK